MGVPQKFHDNTENASCVLGQLLAEHECLGQGCDRFTGAATFDQHVPKSRAALNVVRQVGVAVDLGQLPAQVERFLGEGGCLGQPSRLREPQCVVVQRAGQAGQVGVAVDLGQLSAQVDRFLGDRDRLGPPSCLREPQSRGCSASWPGRAGRRRG